MRKITITCDDSHDEFTSVERDMIEEWLGTELGLTNIKIEQANVNIPCCTCKNDDSSMCHDCGDYNKTEGK